MTFVYSAFGFVIFGVMLLAAIAGSILTIITVARGILRMRFSLRTLMIVMLSGGACATMVLDRAHPMVMIFGVLFSTIYFTVIASYVLVRAAVPDAPENTAELDPQPPFLRGGD